MNLLPDEVRHILPPLYSLPHLAVSPLRPNGALHVRAAGRVRHAVLPGLRR